MPFLAVLEDGRNEVADAVDDPPDVDADHEFPVGGGHVGELDTVHRHAGIVAGDMKFAERPFGLGKCVKHGLFLRHIDAHRHDALVGAGQAMGSLLNSSFLNVGHDHIGTGFRQRRCDAETNA